MVKKTDRLNKYQERRDFAKTAEPKASGNKQKKHTPSQQPLFVIQQHAAQSMHYDLRLEIDGILTSWAVPKGPSTNPHDKRLAVQTEDHPLEYADFEGVIPEGEYGAGEVIVWDRGTYENLKEPKTMSQCLTNGTLEVFLHGEKLQGAYALVRMKTGEKNWLLIKMKDSYADARRNPVSTEPASVISGRTIAELKKSKE